MSCSIDFGNAVQMGAVKDHFRTEVSW